MQREISRIDGRRRIKVPDLAPGTRVRTAEANGRMAVVPDEAGPLRADSQSRITIPIGSSVGIPGDHLTVEQRPNGFVLQRAIVVTFQDIGPELWATLTGQSEQE
jgi:hypothetical protein